MDVLSACLNVGFFFFERHFNIKKLWYSADWGIFWLAVSPIKLLLPQMALRHKTLAVCHCFDCQISDEKATEDKWF